MKIHPLNFLYSVNFSSRKKEIKEADNILRKTSLEFPLFSYTYCDNFYNSAKISSKNYKRTSEIMSNVKYKILNLRNEIYSFDDPYGDLDRTILQLLNSVKKSKYGNCHEMSTAVLAALFANGYYNSSLVVNPTVVMEIINKKSGEVEKRYNYAIDHTFVLTDMNKKDKKQDIVIDPWLSFADNFDNAVTKYKRAFNCFAVEKVMLFDFERLNSSKADFDINDYYIKHKAIIDNANEISLEDKKKLADKLKNEYPSFLLTSVN